MGYTSLLGFINVSETISICFSVNPPGLPVSQMLAICLVIFGVLADVIVRIRIKGKEVSTWPEAVEAEKETSEKETSEKETSEKETSEKETKTE